MLAFEISEIGKRLCIAGTEMSDVLSTGLSWVRRTNRRPERLNFNVGGIISGDSRTHFAWTTPSITSGDEITIRLIDADSWDEPEHIYQPSPNSEIPKPEV